MRTIEEHGRDVASLVTQALAGRASEQLVVDSTALAAHPDRYRLRVTARDVIAPLDLPPFDNSQMDGYAVRSAEIGVGERELDVGDPIPAGSWPLALGVGVAAPVMTGAPIPEGADAVVPIEDVRPDRFPDAGVKARVTVDGPVAEGLFVRRKGSDVKAGSVLVADGTPLRPAHWGTLAASGVAAVEVVRRPRVLLVSTGAELAEPGTVLEPGKIHDANGIALALALVECGAEVVTARVTDDDSALLAAIENAVDSAPVDLLVTSGGVSAGAYEVVRDTFEPRGVTFASVAMQPGGPQGWGHLVVTGHPPLPTVCFPGNPVSSLVSFEAFLRGPLGAAAGRAGRRDARARLAEGSDSPKGKHQIRRARVDEDGLVHLVGGPSSHLLHAYASSGVLAHIPLGVERVEAGDEVVVWSIDE